MGVNSARKAFMNWKVIFGLSLFGLAMAIGTVFVISPKVEPFCWLVIFVICAFVIARHAATRQFLHGFLLGIVNSIWVMAAHIIFFSRYVGGHPQEAAMMQRMPASLSPRELMAITGPFIGVISGIVIGVLALIVAKVLGAQQKTQGRQARSR